MDRVDAKTRSKIMSQVRGRDTKMELAVRPVLEALGFVYQPKGVIGRPDFIQPAAKVSVFLDGCFWHGCPEHYKEPEANAAFWSGKVERNRARDAKVTEQQEANGWRVIRVWEHDLKHLLEQIESVETHRHATKKLQKKGGDQGGKGKALCVLCQDDGGGADKTQCSQV